MELWADFSWLEFCWNYSFEQDKEQLVRLKDRKFVHKLNDCQIFRHDCMYWIALIILLRVVMFSLHRGGSPKYSRTSPRSFATVVAIFLHLRLTFVRILSTGCVMLYYTISSYLTENRHILHYTLDAKLCLRPERPFHNKHTNP